MFFHCALIKAGIEVLAKEGTSGLSLHKVAQKAGVSHAAPYSHYKDKQALIAAISTEGYRMLYERIEKTVSNMRQPPANARRSGLGVCPIRAG
jgi:AcrR family transcriptional regulator